MTGLLRYARSEDVILSQNKAHRFAAHYALVHYRSGAVYSFIPKNACSTLRYSMAVANNCIESPEDWTWIHKNNETFAATLPELVCAPFSFVVLRCPHARLASVFLDKIVDKTPELWQIYRLTRDGFDPDALTFRDFVTLLDKGDLLKENVHWRPQEDFLVYEYYSHVFALERFREAAPILQDEIGFTVQDARSLTGHGTDRVEMIHEGRFADTPISELAQMKRGGRLPSHAQLYDTALAGQVAALYAGDLTLYAAHLDAQLLSFPHLLPT
ncbi:sulfotransferase family 2 domain-containing protein [Alloyangia pacifica]|uniref:sulfotransferase family 2 domain-containing protein n=1 Tax=Alloyangia pacifica TaxID=311180 RepID=UPI001CD31905|nr:sulfotransferase family 2 domain-containing protein [Alloyangia pacifica]MCA0998671.1 sulfotransferase family protein [Alloyangia pacifica]